MLYILIPEGMVFEQTQTQDSKRDMFVDPSGKKESICFQDIIKDVLRHKSRSARSVCKDGLEIYFRSAPCDQRDYLKYSPRNNGKYATKVLPKVVKGYAEHQVKYLGKTSRYGEFWYQHQVLSEERKAEVEARRAEQRDNRRHVGDCPLPT